MVNRLTLILLLVLTASCSMPPKQTVFDQHSWKNIIPADCLSFFDGCNNCRRSRGDAIAACTRKYCATYTRPVCLDAKQ